MPVKLEVNFIIALQLTTSHDILFDIIAVDPFINAHSINMARSLKRKHDSGDVHVAIKEVSQQRSKTDKQSSNASPESRSAVQPSAPVARTLYRVKLRFDVGHDAVSNKRRTALDIFRYGRFQVLASSSEFHTCFAWMTAGEQAIPPAGWEGTLGGTGDSSDLRGRLRQLKKEHDAQTDWTCDCLQKSSNGPASLSVAGARTAAAEQSRSIPAEIHGFGATDSKTLPPWTLELACEKTKLAWKVGADLSASSSTCIADSVRAFVIEPASSIDLKHLGKPYSFQGASTTSEQLWTFESTFNSNIDLMVDRFQTKLKLLESNPLGTIDSTRFNSSKNTLTNAATPYRLELSLPKNVAHQFGRQMIAPLWTFELSLPENLNAAMKRFRTRLGEPTHRRSKTRSSNRITFIRAEFSAQKRRRLSDGNRILQSMRCQTSYESPNDEESYFEDWTYWTDRTTLFLDQRKRKVASFNSQLNQQGSWEYPWKSETYIKPIAPWRISIAKGKVHIRWRVYKEAVAYRNRGAPPAKHILRLPVELQRHIFSYLVSDLHIELSMEGYYPEAPYGCRCLVAGHDVSWHAVILPMTVSRKFRAALLDAIRWAAAHGHISLIIDVQLQNLHWTRWTGPHVSHYLPLQFFDGSDRVVPTRILKLFHSAVFIVPLHVMARGVVPELGRVKIFRVIVAYSPVYNGFDVASVEWSTLTPTGYSQENITLEPAFDMVDQFVRDLFWDQSMPRQLGARRLFYAITVVHMIFAFTGDAFAQDMFGTGLIIDPIRQSIERAEETERANLESSRDGSSPLAKFKLGWRGSGPSIEWTTIVYGDGRSFQEKWAACAELINSRRWEEEKIRKLGWRGPASALPKQRASLRKHLAFPNGTLARMRAKRAAIKLYGPKTFAESVGLSEQAWLKVIGRALPDTKQAGKEKIAESDQEMQILNAFEPGWQLASWEQPNTDALHIVWCAGWLKTLTAPRFVSPSGMFNPVEILSPVHYYIDTIWKLTNLKLFAIGMFIDCKILLQKYISAENEQRMWQYVATEKNGRFLGSELREKYKKMLRNGINGSRGQK